MSEQPIFRDGLLDGQVALITGGGTGIGLGISTLLSQLGAHVVVASRKAEHLETATNALGAHRGGASWVAVDVRDHDAVRAMVQRVGDERGRVDILVNNAAGNFYAPSETMSPNAWRAVVEIDLYGTFFCSQAVAPVMRAQGGGRIVNISMTLHYRGWPQMAHATAAKAGIDALTRTLAVEWAPHRILVNAVAPGPVPTEGVKRAFNPPNAGAADVFAIQRAMGDYATKSIPVGRWGTPEDIANMVAFLVSPAGEWITGAIFVVDGGAWLARGAD
ncbi:MAG TPA: SDR family oxidoreductase [Gemmatimonadaceae bacterium]|nr:SDR family oxidoreductase [Gemmatimonadaceae bacterium]